MMVALLVGLRHRDAHLPPVVAVEGVALHDRRVDLLAHEDVLEGPGHRGRASPGRAGDGDDGVLGRHVFSCRYCRPGSEQGTGVEQRVVEGWLRSAWLAVIALDPLDFVPGSQDQRGTLVQARRLEVHDALAPGARAAAGLLDDERPDVAVEGESVNALAGGEDQHGGRPVQGEARAHLSRTRLEKVLDSRLGSRVGAAQDREDRADRDVGVNVARTVERVEHEQVFSAPLAFRDRVDVRHLFGRHPGGGDLVPSDHG